MSSSTSPENPHLVDIFRTAMSPDVQPDQDREAPRIVVNGNNNVVAFGGGRIVINERQSARPSKRA